MGKNVFFPHFSRGDGRRGVGEINLVNAGKYKSISQSEAFPYIQYEAATST